MNGIRGVSISRHKGHSGDADNNPIYVAQSTLGEHVAGDLGLLRIHIDQGDEGVSGYTYGSIISDNTENGESYQESNPITTTGRTAGLTSVGGFNRVTFPTVSTGGSGHTLYIASSSADDDYDLAIGARVVYIQYLDVNWQPQTVHLRLQGQTVVDTNTGINHYTEAAAGITNMIRVNRMMVAFIGASAPNMTNVGAITVSATNDHVAGVPQTDIVNAIATGYSYSACAIYSTPANTRLYFTRGSYYTTASSDKPMRYAQFSTFPWEQGTPNENRSTWSVGDLSVSQTAAFNTSGSAPEFPYTDIEFVAQRLGSGNVDVNANVFWNTLRITDTNNFG